MHWLTLIATHALAHSDCDSCTCIYRCFSLDLVFIAVPATLLAILASKTLWRPQSHCRRCHVPAICSFAAIVCCAEHLLLQQKPSLRGALLSTVVTASNPHTEICHILPYLSRINTNAHRKMLWSAGTTRGNLNVLRRTSRVERRYSYSQCVDAARVSGCCCSSALQRWSVPVARTHRRVTYLRHATCIASRLCHHNSS